MQVDLFESKSSKMSSPKPERNKSVIVYLNAEEYEKTHIAAEHIGLLAGPFVRMHLKELLRTIDKDNKKKAEANGQ